MTGNPRKPSKWPKYVPSRLERQFATLCLFHALAGDGAPRPNLAAIARQKAKNNFEDAKGRCFANRSQKRLRMEYTWDGSSDRCCFAKKNTRSSLIFFVPGSFRPNKNNKDQKKHDIFFRILNFLGKKRENSQRNRGPFKADTLIFFSLLFWWKARKNTKETIPGKKGKTHKKQGIPCKTKKQGIPSKARKRRLGSGRYGSSVFGRGPRIPFRMADAL